MIPCIWFGTCATVVSCDSFDLCRASPLSALPPHVGMCTMYVNESTVNTSH